MKIGIFDSGIGGLSVLHEAYHQLPKQEFIFYADTQNVPYGTKSPEKIKELTFSCVEKLMDHGIKALVVACNTATSAAIKDLRLKYGNMPIIGIEPAVKPAVVCSRGGRIIVMAWWRFLISILPSVSARSPSRDQTRLCSVVTVPDSIDANSIISEL